MTCWLAKKLGLLALLLLTGALSSLVHSLRCYTDLEATKANSVECGMNTGCLKIYKKARGFDRQNKFIPPEHRGSDIQLFRGCFLVSVPDTCYDSISSDLSYCWCSQRDLCNSKVGAEISTILTIITLLTSVFQLQPLGLTSLWPNYRPLYSMLDSHHSCRTCAQPTFAVARSYERPIWSLSSSHLPLCTHYKNINTCAHTL